MNFLYKREYLNAGDLAVANSDHECNVLLMDDNNFSRFKRGERHSYYGGFFDRMPARVPAPSSGNGNAVVHAGGSSTSIGASNGFIKS